jgi:hypothetical protein
MGGTMGLKLIVGAYFTFVATIVLAGVVLLSVGYMHNSQADAFDGAYLTAH